MMCAFKLGKKDKVLNQLTVTCRKKILGTLKRKICRVQCTAYCDTGSRAETLIDDLAYPEKLMTLCSCVPCGT